jgi:hypothetical protein
MRHRIDDPTAAQAPAIASSCCGKLFFRKGLFGSD